MEDAADHLGIDSQAPTRARARSPDDVGAFGDSEPDYASGDRVYGGD
jgi:hypothetical protein